MDTSNYYHGLNRPSTSTTMTGGNIIGNSDGGIRMRGIINTNYSISGGNDVSNYYNQRENYNISNYPDDSMLDINNMGQYQRMDHMTSSYYEPIFRPPPTSCYAHNYTRHNVDPNPSFIAPPPPSSSFPLQQSSQYPPPTQSVHIGWYQQPPSSGGHYEQSLNMLQFSSR